MARKINNPYLKGVKTYLAERYGEAHAERIVNAASERLEALILENAAEPKAMYQHTRDRIYPAIATMKAMISDGMARDAAAQVLLDYYDARSKKVGVMIRRLMRIPGLYKLVPKFFGNMTNKSFGESAGFRAQWYVLDNREMRFDMLECPYQKLCEWYDCGELTKGFCYADDNCYGNMHPELVWGRTKTLGTGGECCDFKLSIRE